jgi:hypothetical protein
MNPSDVRVDDPAPQRALITSREELHAAVLVALRVAKRSVRVLHRDMSVFGLSALESSDALLQLLLGHRAACVRLLVDDASWLETRAPRLRLLQRRFPHALELRVASTGDPVGDDAVLLADDHTTLELKPTPAPTGDLWLHHRPHAQPRLSSFERRWEAGGHNLPVAPLGLG